MENVLNEMKNMEKISIIVPCYNVEKYIKQCLDSVVNQTYNNLEIICVNDGSTDNTLDIIKKYALKDDRIVIIDQNNTGLSGARNSGIKCSTGDYIVFVDSDDFIELNTCEKAITEALKDDYDLIIWNYTKEFSNSSVDKLIFDDKEIVFNEKSCKAILRRRIFGLIGKELSKPEDADSLVTAWGKMYKSKIIKEKQVYFIDTKIIGTEDAYFNALVFKHIKKALYIPNCLNHYRKDNISSLTTIYKSDLSKKWSTLYKYLEDLIETECLDSDFKCALNNRIALSIIGLGLNELTNPKGAFYQIKNIREFLKSKQYRNAYKTLELKYFPIHWKLFFFFAKYNLSIAVYIILKAINFLKGKVK